MLKSEIFEQFEVNNIVKKGSLRLAKHNITTFNHELTATHHKAKYSQPDNKFICLAKNWIINHNDFQK